MLIYMMTQHMLSVYECLKCYNRYSCQCVLLAAWFQCITPQPPCQGIRTQRHLAVTSTCTSPTRSSHNSPARLRYSFLVVSASLTQV